MLPSLKSISVFGVSFQSFPKLFFGILSVVDSLRTLCFVSGRTKGQWLLRAKFGEYRRVINLVEISAVFKEIDGLLFGS